MSPVLTTAASSACTFSHSLGWASRISRRDGCFVSAGTGWRIFPVVGLLDKALSVSVAVPNALLLVGDPAGDPPTTMGRHLVRANASCIAVGTRPDVDGQTSVHLSTRRPAGEHRCVFRGSVELTSRRVTVASVLNDTLLDAPIDRDQVQIEIWVNDETEPDEVYVVVDGDARR